MYKVQSRPYRETKALPLPTLRNKSASCHRVGADYQQEAAKQVYGFQVALLLCWRLYNNNNRVGFCLPTLLSRAY